MRAKQLEPARLDFPFTRQDTPALRERVTRDIEHVSRTLQREDGALDALILTGGFSRGEGSARHDAPLNDYDLVAVRARPWGASDYARLHARLSREVGLDVDVLPVARQRLPFVGRKLFWLDVRLGGRVLLGDPTTLDRLPRFGASAVPPLERARLLANRAAGLLLALPGPGHAVDAHAVDLQAAKAALGAMDAHLLAQGRYDARLLGRAGMAGAHPFARTFERATSWKLAPPEKTWGDAWWSEARDALLHVVDETRAETALDGPAEHVVHALRAKRLAVAPSRRVRLAAWTLLRSSRFPDGPHDLARARAHVPGGSACNDWPALKSRFFGWRATTLQ